MASRLLLIWLVLLHAVASPAAGLGLRQAAQGLCGPETDSRCTPQSACATAQGCCCEASPTEDFPRPEPVRAPQRGAEPALVPADAPKAGFVPASREVSFRSISSEPGPEPQLRRLARLCVWRT